MDRSHDSRFAGRDRGVRRIRSVTAWAAVGATALAAVMGMVFARSATAAPAGRQPGTDAGTGAGTDAGTDAGTGSGYDDQGGSSVQDDPQLQPPAQAPGWDLGGGGHHASSGGS
jgi:hypothetical protein